MPCIWGTDLVVVASVRAVTVLRLSWVSEVPVSTRSVTAHHQSPIASRTGEPFGRPFRRPFLAIWRLSGEMVREMACAICHSLLSFAPFLGYMIGGVIFGGGFSRVGGRAGAS